MGQKGRQIFGVVVNMITGCPLGRDVDSAHPHLMRHPQIARVIFEHGGAGGVKPVNGKDGLKGSAVGFGVKAGVLHPINRIEQPCEPARL